ncbi:PD40 domain-containing protein [Winogradskyella tangerina]|uniref:PD40 domain-containing protein n=1 Tax=Winogradskyella tangerina TaxID=2023240 RepID=UPI000DBE4288|nr:PD40 domain-containing protein [Winogradskyella tangerina]
MKSLSLLFCLAFIILSSCQKETPNTNQAKQLTFEKINYYRYSIDSNSKPYKYRLEYYFDNGKPHRWLELDSTGTMMTDYIYAYNENWQHIGARYREDGTEEFSIEQVTYKNDSTMVTEWLDSLGTVYYTMIDNLNKLGKTYRAEFIGDTTHGYDSTFYTTEGFPKRIFFTNTKGKVYNDRRFEYDSVNAYGDWVIRKKIMGDTIQEIQKRETYYDKQFTSEHGKYLEGIISSGKWSENVISFTEDESVIFLTRTSDWENQFAFTAEKKNGIYTVTNSFEALDTIYNGAISPSGNKIIYSKRHGDSTSIHLMSRVKSNWYKHVKFNNISKIQGGYFFWLNNSEVCFQNKINNGDLVFAEIKNDQLIITDSLDTLNTNEGTEFSPYIAPDRAYIIFTRYTEGDIQNQGFFISHNSGNAISPKWEKPIKLNMLPYGWSANIINNGSQFIYTNGDDIYSVPIEKLKLK